MCALKGSALHIFRRDGSCPVRNAGCPRRDRAAYTVGSRGDGTLPFLALRSVGHTSVSASSSSRLGLLDLGNGAGSGAASDDCPLGAGSAAGSAVPSMTFAASPARAASMVWMTSMACSISSSLIALTPPLCSTFVSRGTSNASILRYTPGWLRALLLNFRHQGKKAIENELLVQQMTRAVPVAVRCSPCTTNLEIGDRHGSPNFKRK